MMPPAPDAADLAASERRLRFLDQLAEATWPLHDAAEIMRTTARLLGEHLGASRCAYAPVSDDGEHFDLVGDYTRGVRSILGRYALSDFGRPFVALMRRGEPYVNDDVDNDPRTAGTDLTAYRVTQIRAVISVPLLRDGRFVAGMAVHQDVPRRWRPDEVALVQRVVARCWESLERLRAEGELREAHQRLSLALEAGELGDWSWDARTDELVMGERAADILGLPHGAPIPWAALDQRLHEDDRERARQAMEACAAQGRPCSITCRVQVGDQWRWISVQGKPTQTADSAFRGMTGVVQDVSRRQREAEEKLLLLDSERAARGEAERANAVKNDFLATLSHELRTPLGAILGWTQILRHKLPPHAPELLKGVDVIEHNARAQTRLIDELLDMSRIASGKLRLDLQPVAPVAFVEAAVDTVRPQAAAAGVWLDVQLDGTVGPVAGDPARLQQVVWNLLGNAVKFTPAGGTVRVRLAQHAGWVEIAVSDTGVGIRPEFLPHLFDRFRQADASTTRRFGGLGLGLSIVRHLVELHGGEVQADSAGEGAGACFTVRLPARSPAPAWAVRESSEAAVPPARRAGEGISLAGVRVLLVDDEPDTLDLMRRVLEECSAQVSTAGGALAALQMLAQQPFDVLVSDIGMPGVDGYELLRRLRERPARAGGQVPAVALTAFVRPTDRLRVLQSGFAVHVAKPADPFEVVSAVARLARLSLSGAAGG
ncbi:hybrid sensor histidine kinase/response regulator [Ramlibacter tataouinensis]|uniref:Virulence sensor protein BvgS n=1 Tax=Ramlibacter tataouinensis (strain ATCC BAA-407 / DSM 14655 / LMG 21543 / TTB310) TaxID=365046 RepID=F5Y2U4_RAMTT|nr:GAF domain-containing hybrid sensor histidine kinase/response regulator [Ramlibacter tataouinensis]AEG93640.1 candidate histidine kinase, hybrid [Ramlibacter tataouinensis TTB310]